MTPHTKADLTPNNFDLLRLIAASQVMLAHCDHYLLHRDGWIHYLPGVPIFFFISGYLISASWERTPEVFSYARNRVLRIFPALWTVWASTLAMLLIFFDSSLPRHHGLRLIAWSVMQTTIFQNWYPSFFQGFGTGMLNGSLWTIPVELGFYVATPLLYALGRRTDQVNGFFATITALCWIGLVTVTLSALSGTAPRWLDWISLSPMPWLGMFMMGLLAQRYRVWLLPRLRGKLLILLMVYASLAFLASRFALYPLLRSNGNAMGLVNYVALCALVLCAAYTQPGLADKILRRDDISYGMYLFHLPILNLALYLGLTDTRAYLAVGLGTVTAASLCWFLVEKPALALRHHPLLTRSR